MINANFYFDLPVNAESLKADQEALKAEWQSEKSGYYSLPDGREKLIDMLNKYQVETKEFDTIVVVGIGGSSLGTKAADRMLRHLPQRNTKRLIFLENADPIELSTTIKTINPRTTLFLIVSKSGSTIETTSIFKLVLSVLGAPKDDKSCAKHIAVITDPLSPLDQLAKEYGFARFHLPKTVGGRFSVLSAVGLVPLILVGYDVNAMLEGARATRDGFFMDDPLKLSAKARYYVQNYKTLPINTLFGYASSFEEITKWYVQLWGESLGKLDSKKNRVGLTPIGLIGSVDQHSFLQLIMEGPKDKTVTFLKVASFENGLTIPEISLKGLEGTDYVNGEKFRKLINSQQEATRDALVANGVACDELVLDRFDEWHVGALFMAYELLTSLAGVAFGINTYDQPGVEMGKQILVKNFKR